MPVRDEHMTKIVAGMGVADMDFRCAPSITAALQKRVAFPNWGYNIIDGDLFMGNAGDTPFIKFFLDRKSTRLNSSHDQISYAVFCLKKKHNMLSIERYFRLTVPLKIPYVI